MVIFVGILSTKHTFGVSVQSSTGRECAPFPQNGDGRDPSPATTKQHGGDGEPTSAKMNALRILGVAVLASGSHNLPFCGSSGMFSLSYVVPYCTSLILGARGGKLRSRWMPYLQQDTARKSSWCTSIVFSCRKIVP